jgi:hypothetical protein
MRGTGPAAGLRRASHGTTHGRRVTETAALVRPEGGEEPPPPTPPRRDG